MTEEIKEILELFAFTDENIMFCDIVELNSKQSHLLLDYITNLQQDLDKANDIIEKDRQFYKCRMDEYVDLKKENERLKEENKTYQEYPFIIIEKNGVICRKNQEIERLNNIINELEKYIGQEWYCFDNESIEFEVSKNILEKLKELKKSGNNE